MAKGVTPVSYTGYMAQSLMGGGDVEKFDGIGNSV
jgi:hypothetical protein